MTERYILTMHEAHEAWQTHMHAFVALDDLLRELSNKHKQDLESAPGPFLTHNGKGDEPLEGALINLRVINTEIPSKVKQALGLSGVVVEFKSPSFSLRRIFEELTPSFGAKIIYNPSVSEKLLLVPPTERPKPVPLTPEMLERYWSGNINRNLVRTLGVPSISQTLDTFKSTLQTSVRKYV